MVDREGRAVAGWPGTRGLSTEGFRSWVVETILTTGEGHLIDRVYTPRIVAFAPIAASDRHLVAVVDRREFGADLDSMLRRGLVVFVASLLLAALQGMLLSRHLARPIEVLTGPVPSSR